jgi:ABC-type transporter Mla subunit MlaD
MQTTNAPSSDSDAPAPASTSASTDASGGETVAGGLIIPDLSALSTLQNDNMKKMTDAVQTAAQGLQGIVTMQKQTLQQAVQNLQSSLDSSVTIADAGPGKVPDVEAQIQNLTVAIDNLNAAAQTLTASTTKSFDTISQSMQESLSTIEQVAEKFSSGG